MSSQTVLASGMTGSVRGGGRCSTIIMSGTVVVMTRGMPAAGFINSFFFPSTTTLSSQHFRTPCHRLDVVVVFPAVSVSGVYSS
jgi:hypothetical protein